MPFDFLDFVAHGLMPLPWWGYFVVALVMTHITIACVTIFLHRAQAHRALDLHPAASVTSSGSGYGSRRAWSRRNGSPSTASTTPGWKRRTTRTARRRVASARSCLGRHGALSHRSQERGNYRKIRPRHARRLDGAQRLHALLVGRCGPDADGEFHALRRRGRHDLGRSRWRGFRSRRQASSTASATTGAIATSPPPMLRRTSCRGAS